VSLGDAGNRLVFRLDNGLEAIADCLSICGLIDEIDPKLIDFPPRDSICSPLALKAARSSEGAEQSGDGRDRRCEIRPVIPLLSTNRASVAKPTQR